MAFNVGQTESVEVYTNKFLDPITSWEEKNVAGYKKQVFLHGFSGWMMSFFIFVIFNTMLSAAGGLIMLPFVFLSPEQMGIGYFALATVLMIIAATIIGYKKTKKLIKRNNGEIGHRGKPFAVHSVFNFIFGIVIAGAAVVGFSYLVYQMYLSSIETPDPDFFEVILPNLILVANFAVPFFYPLFYFLGTMIGIGKMRHSYTCPVCGRFDSIVIEKESFAKSKTGDYERDITRTARVGTETTTTYWSDGTTTSSSSPIYGQVYDHTDVHEVGTKMERYFVNCRGCSFHREFTEKVRYDEVVGRYN